MAQQAQPADSLLQNQMLLKALRVMVSVTAAILVIIGLRWGISFMTNPDAPEQLLVNWYTRLNMDEALATLLDTGLSPLAGKLMITAVALVIGVAGVWVLYGVANDLIDMLPLKYREQIRPIVFVGPALLLLGVYLVYPTIRTIMTSLSEDIVNAPEIVPEEYWASDTIVADLIADSENFTLKGYLLNLDLFEIARIQVNEKNAWLIVRPKNITDEETGETRRVFALTTIGLQNYRFAFTSPDMLVAFRNNVLWLLIGTSGSVAIGLLVAMLVDRVKREALAKSFIFMPLAISFVGASVIWKFVYAWAPAGRDQVGLFNAIVTSFGKEPIPWIIQPPMNTLALIVIMIWLQTGFCMVILSAALKGVPSEIIEASRIDGATELQLFFKIIIPMIRGSIITVSTTVFIAILKVFDIVYVMTSGKFDTEVVANRMFVEMFTFRNFGRASSLAVILLIVVTPIMVVNIRNLRRQGIN